MPGSDRSPDNMPVHPAQWNGVSSIHDLEGGSNLTKFSTRGRRNSLEFHYIALIGKQYKHHPVLCGNTL